MSDQAILDFTLDRNDALFIDFDGTLANREGEIHPRDAAILQARDRHPVRFILATGRPFHSVRRTFERNGIFVDRPVPLPLVPGRGPLSLALDRKGYEQTSRQAMVPFRNRKVIVFRISKHVF